MSKRKEYEGNIDNTELMVELKELCDEDEYEQQQAQMQNNDRELCICSVGDGGTEYSYDFKCKNVYSITVVRKRSNVISKQECCEQMRGTNPEQ